MEAARVGGEKPVCPSCEIIIPPWLHDEMQMIRHQAGGEHRDVELVKTFGEQPEKCHVVRTVMKKRHAIVAAIEDVVAVIRDDGA